MGQVGVLEMVKKRQDEWEGRLERMDSERCNKRAFEGVVKGRRPRVRPIKKDGWIIYNIHNYINQIAMLHNMHVMV